MAYRVSTYSFSVWKTAKVACKLYVPPHFYDDPYWIAELDALEADMGSEADGVPSYLQPDKEEPDLDAELSLPSAPTGNAAAAGRSNAQVKLFPFKFSRVLCYLLLLEL